MLRPAHPQRVYEIADRLSNYFEEDGVVVQVKYLNRQGNYISVSRDSNTAAGLLFHADELDNGASGFRLEALEKIRSYIEHRDYVAPPVKPGLRYDDVMTHDGQPANNGEVPLV